MTTNTPPGAGSDEPDPVASGEPAGPLGPAEPVEPAESAGPAEPAGPGEPAVEGDAFAGFARIGRFAFLPGSDLSGDWIAEEAGDDPVPELPDGEVEERLATRRTLLDLGRDFHERSDAVYASELRILSALRAEALSELESTPVAASLIMRDLAIREAAAEYAVVTNRDPRSVAALMERAHEFATRFPATLDALGDGTISRQHADAIRVEGEVIEDDDRRGVYEQVVLDAARTKAAGQLRSFAKRVAEQFRTESLADRHERVRRRRRVWWTPDEDGMSWFGGYGPTLEVAAIYDTLTAGAKAQKAANAKAVTALRKAGDRAGADATTDPRTRDEMRFDLFTELLLTTDLNRAGSQDGAVGGIRANIDVLVSADALVGDPNLSASTTAPSSRNGNRASRTTTVGPTDASPADSARAPAADPTGTSSVGPNGPAATGETVSSATVDQTNAVTLEPHEVALLNGRHPIPVPAARELLSTCTSFLRILTDPTTGMPTSVDRRHPTKQMKDYLRVRDRMCRFPGCTARPADCEDDHTIPWEDGGKTSIGNLGELCPGHHTLKHHSRFDLEQLEPGVFAWTTPAGQRVTTRPDDFDLRRQIQQAIEDRIADDEPWRRRRPDPDRGESSVRFRDDAWDPADADKPTSINLARVVHERQGGCPPGCTSCTPLDQIPRPPTSRDPDDEPPF